MSESAATAHRNRLAASTSPYLRQHAANPVDWYEWGPEALGRAEREQRPILLSVGYSACHWCHVMAHESFEDDATAALLNDTFVNIKVDREERPDIDAIYQKVVQMMGQGGGWPLTVFLTPAGKPFYGGTYFPKESNYGRPSFRQVIETLAGIWRDDPAKIEQQVESFMQGFEVMATMADAEAEDGPALDDASTLERAATELLTRFDADWGGFGREPKFPNQTSLEVLALRSRADDDAAAALQLTLDRMYQGGIYDHLRGGFARYSVDRVWLVPHFEKMLYDNAQLLALYAEAAVHWPDAKHYRRVTAEIVEYLVADMRDEHGTFYAATDADSEGEEGKYFCWTPSEVAEVVGDRELAQLFCRVYGVTERGNFEHGWSILNLDRTLAERAEDLDTTVDDLLARLQPARAKLLAHRYGRVPPLRDEKVLTSWNGLLVSGLARASTAASAWDRELAAKCRDLAIAAATRLCEAHVEGIFDGSNGVVHRASFEGRVHTRGIIEDVAFLARALLDLHELTLDPIWRDRAASLARHALARYARESHDGFYLTASDAEALIERTESQHDGPIPSGLGVMLEVLLRLDYGAVPIEGARATIDAILKRYRGAAAQPFAYASLLTAAAHAAPQSRHVTVRGPSPTHPSVQAMASAVRSARLGIPSAIAIEYAQADDVTAIVCEGTRVCSAPLPTVEDVLAVLAR
jgi:uncharacterized protein YyaL (SSP411 family)